jgi:phosphatidylglycerophosphate synthase
MHPVMRAGNSRLLWLPNMITLCRYILSVIALIAILHHEWRAGFWLYSAAIATDFLDGLVAKKLNAQTKFGASLDKWADVTSVLTGMLGLAATHRISWWIFILVPTFWILTESIDTPWWPEKVLAVTSLITAWTAILWYFADLAFGWSWDYILLTVVILSICASLKQHRIRAWLKNTG